MCGRHGFSFSAQHAPLRQQQTQRHAAAPSSTIQLRPSVTVTAGASAAAACSSTPAREYYHEAAVLASAALPSAPAPRLLQFQRQRSFSDIALQQQQLFFFSVGSSTCAASSVLVFSIQRVSSSAQRFGDSDHRASALVGSFIFISDSSIHFSFSISVGLRVGSAMPRHHLQLQRQ